MTVVTRGVLAGCRAGCDSALSLLFAVQLYGLYENDACLAAVRGASGVGAAIGVALLVR